MSDVHVVLKRRTFAYSLFFNEPVSCFCLSVLREYFMCSYVAVRRCFVSAAEETELHQLQSEDIEQEENGSAAPGLAAQNQQTIRVIN